MAVSMKVLIAYDGSPCADAALDDLKRAGLPGAVEVLVVSVAEFWLPPPSATFKPVLSAVTEPTPAPVEAARNLAIEASQRFHRGARTQPVSAVHARQRGDGCGGARALLGRNRPH